LFTEIWNQTTFLSTTNTKWLLLTITTNVESLRIESGQIVSWWIAKLEN
jgi:hypothetical protein